MRHFELLEIHRYIERTGEHDFDADLPGYDDIDPVESNPLMVGTAKDVVNYLLKHELKNYKLVEKKK